MKDFPETEEALLAVPFLTEPEWDTFKAALLQSLRSVAFGEAVLCVEADRIQALAVIFATILKQGGVFLGDPGWRKSEWQAVNALVGFDRVFGDVPLIPQPGRAPRFHEPRILIPTGGTVGGIRFCVHTLATLTAAVNSLHAFHGEAPLNSINPLGVFHVSGLMPVIRACLTGGRVRFSDWKSLEKGLFPPPGEGEWTLSLVPAQLDRLIRMEAGLRFLHGLDVIYLGGAKTPVGLANAIRSEKLPVLFVYGMTESAAMVVTGSRADTDSAGKVWGRPLPGVSVSLTREHEIVLQSRSLFRGYFPDDIPQNDYATGDLGQWAVDGRLEVLGRKDFLINTGGEKVNPEEVEACLAECLPGRSVAVTSQPHPTWGERLVAVIEAELTEPAVETLRHALKQKLAGHKIPKKILTGQSIPRTALGKVKRVELRALVSGR